MGSSKSFAGRRQNNGAFETSVYQQFGQVEPEDQLRINRLEMMPSAVLIHLEAALSATREGTSGWHSEEGVPNLGR
jgi:hypothetical protein